MTTLTSSSEQVIIITGFQKVFSCRKSSRLAEQPMKTPATTWAACLEMGSTPLDGNPAASAAEAVTAPMSIPAGTRLR